MGSTLCLLVFHPAASKQKRCQHGIRAATELSRQWKWISKEGHKLLFSRDPSIVQDHEKVLAEVEFLYPPLEVRSQPSGDSPISKPLSHSPLATAIHIVGIPPAFILSSSLPWLPTLTQHTKLRDKERQGHMEGEENSASQPAQHGVYRQERKQSCPRLALGEGVTRRQHRGEEEQTGRAGA